MGTVSGKKRLNKLNFKWWPEVNKQKGLAENRPADDISNIRKHVVTLSVAASLSLFLLASSCVLLCTSRWSFQPFQFCSLHVLRTMALQWVSLQRLSISHCKWTCIWTHRYLVGVLLPDQSDIFYSLFCGADKADRGVNGHVRPDKEISRSDSTDTTQMRSKTKRTKKKITKVKV